MEATTAVVPVVPPEGAELGFALAVFYCREQDHDTLAARLVEERGASVRPRFDMHTGERRKGEVKWTENGIKCSLEVAPVFHRLSAAVKS